MRPKRVRMTKEQMTEKMVNDLKLDEKQAKKVTKLNKKFKTLIEGEQQNNMKGQRPPMGQGRPDGNRVGGRPGGGFGSGMPGGGSVRHMAQRSPQGDCSKKKFPNIIYLQFVCECYHLLLGFLRLLFVDLGRDKAHIFYLPVVADVTELSCGSVIDTRRIG